MHSYIDVRTRDGDMTGATTPPLLIGCGAGFSGDRTDAAGPVVDTLIARLKNGPSEQRAFLIFETLAERTLALAQLRRRADPGAGYEPLLDDMLRPVLARAMAAGIRIVRVRAALGALIEKNRVRGDFVGRVLAHSLKE